jgi:hypothetical protein
MNRDMNACLNILKIAEEWINTKTRPESFVEIITLRLKKHKTWLISCFY